MAFLPFLTEISFSSALVLTVVLAIMWEIYEKMIRVRESAQNILVDILLPIVAFVITSIALTAYQLRRDELMVAATAVLAVYIFTNVSGWLAYRRRNRDFVR